MQIVRHKQALSTLAIESRKRISGAGEGRDV